MLAKLLTLLVTMVLAGVPLLGTPVALFPNSGWSTFEWSDASPGHTTAISDPTDGYTVTSADPLVLKIVDCCSAGDVFQVSIDGLLTSTSLVTATYDDALIYDPEQAWADPRFSRGEFVLDPGTHTISLAVTQVSIYRGTLEVNGNAWIEVTTPEPSTLVLVGLAMLGFGRIAFRRHGY